MLKPYILSAAAGGYTVFSVSFYTPSLCGAGGAYSHDYALMHLVKSVDEQLFNLRKTVVALMYQQIAVALYKIGAALLHQPVAPEHLSRQGRDPHI